MERKSLTNKRHEHNNSNFDILRSKSKEIQQKKSTEVLVTIDSYTELADRQWPRFLKYAASKVNLDLLAEVRDYIEEGFGDKRFGTGQEGWRGKASRLEFFEDLSTHLYQVEVYAHASQGKIPSNDLQLYDIISEDKELFGEIIFYLVHKFSDENRMLAYIRWTN